MGIFFWIQVLIMFDIFSVMTAVIFLANNRVVITGFQRTVHLRSQFSTQNFNFIRNKKLHLLSRNYSFNDDRNNFDVLKVAEIAAKKAGKVMLQNYGKVDVLKTKANVRDIVTAIDFDCQKIIENVII